MSESPRCKDLNGQESCNKVDYDPIINEPAALSECQNGDILNNNAESNQHNNSQHSTDGQNGHNITDDVVSQSTISPTIANITLPQSDNTINQINPILLSSSSQPQDDEDASSLSNHPSSHTSPQNTLVDTISSSSNDNSIIIGNTSQQPQDTSSLLSMRIMSTTPTEVSSPSLSSSPTPIVLSTSAVQSSSSSSFNNNNNNGDVPTITTTTSITPIMDDMTSTSTTNDDILSTTRKRRLSPIIRQDDDERTRGPTTTTTTTTSTTPLANDTDMPIVSLSSIDNTPLPLPTTTAAATTTTTTTPTMTTTPVATPQIQASLAPSLPRLGTTNNILSSSTSSSPLRSRISASTMSTPIPATTTTTARSTPMTTTTTTTTTTATPHNGGGTSKSIAPSSRSLIMSQFKELSRSPPPGVTVNIDSHNIYKWPLIIFGPPGTPYEGGIFPATISFPTDYPTKPPVFTFLTPNFVHPNVFPDGKVCISILHDPNDPYNQHEPASEKWRPVLGIEQIILSIISLLAEPNCNSPANVDYSNMYKNSPKEYKKQVILMVRRTQEEQ